MQSSVMRESKMSKLSLIVAGTFLVGAHAMAADGLTTIPSSYGPKETMDRLEAEIEAKGMTVFARIDHAAGAAQAGLPVVAADRVAHIRQRQGGYAVDAVQPDHRHRPAIEGVGLAGCGRQGLVVL